MDLKLIWLVISRNLTKSILSVLILFCIMGILATFDEREYRNHNIISKFEDHGETQYVIPDGDGYEIVTLGDGYELVSEEKISYSAMTGVFWAFIFFGSILIISLLIASSDPSSGWEVRHIKSDYLLSKVKKDKEGSVYFYHLNGKLLTEKHVDKHYDYDHSPLNKYQIERLVEIYMTSPETLDNYQGTKSERREKRISKVLNK